MNKKNILTYVIIFLIIYFGMQLLMPKQENSELITGGDFVMSTTKKEFDQHQTVAVKIRNNSDQTVTIKNECPGEPLDVTQLSNGAWVTKTHDAPIKCDETSDTIIPPDSEKEIQYKFWHNALFNEIARYKLRATLQLEKAIDGASTKTIESNEFEIKPQGWFDFLWTFLLFQPIYNVLIYLTTIIPGRDLGLAIILLTVIIRTILLVPSQRALKSQRKMQAIQPKLAKIREKYKDNQEMIAKETMLLWKDHKVNPLSSCLPLLIQFPVLIALFYVIQNGLNPDNAYLLYGSLQSSSLQNVNVNFLNILDLTKVNSFVLPLVVAGLQFFQMKLAILKREKNNQKTEKKAEKSEMESANQAMLYVMPIMIAIFTASAPAGVGLYWGVSTLYGVAQQFIVNRQVDAESVKVKVLPDKK